MAITATKTGIMPTALVAVEQHFPRPQRIVDNECALRMLPPGARLFVWLLRSRWMRDGLIRLSERDDAGIWGGLLCRKRYIVEKLAGSATEIEAVVNLGAGFDTQACCLGVLQNVPMWEIDQRETIEAKAIRLRRAMGALPANLTLIAADLGRENLGAVLARAGYSPGARTFFVWEAVTQYLTEEGVRATFDYLAQAAAGSRLAFTYVRKDFLNGDARYGWAKGFERFVASKLWQFGLLPDTCPEFVARYGWRVAEDLGYDELAKRYIEPTGRRLTATLVERMVYAEKG